MTYFALLATLIAAILILVVFGRNGEFFPGLRFKPAWKKHHWESGSVEVEGGVLKAAAGPVPVEVWATSPSLTVRADGLSPETPLTVANLLPLGFYGQMDTEAIMEAGNGKLLITRPGAYEFVPRAGGQYSFAVMGDPREHVETLARALETARECLFAVIVGDLADRGDRAHLSEIAGIAGQSPIPVYCTVGNHDLQGGGRKYYREFFGDEDYSFKIGPDLFAVMDNGADYPRLGDTRLKKLEEALAAGPHRNAFVFMHMPPLDPRPGHCHHMQCVPMKNQLGRIIARHRPTLLFASHIHHHVTGNFEGVEVVVAGAVGAAPQLPFSPNYIKVQVNSGEATWTFVS